jgi:hypothetical protein
MLRELTSLNSRYTALQDEHSDTESALHRLMCKTSAMEAMTTIEECEELERTLKASLDVIEVKKVGMFIVLIFLRIQFAHFCVHIRHCLFATR